MSVVPSLVKQEKARLQLALEMIFREVVFNMLATSVDEAATLRWIQRRAESIYCDMVDSDNENAKQNSVENIGTAT